MPSWKGPRNNWNTATRSNMFPFWLKWREHEANSQHMMLIFPWNPWNPSFPSLEEELCLCLCITAPRFADPASISKCKFLLWDGNDGFCGFHGNINIQNPSLLQFTVVIFLKELCVFPSAWQLMSLFGDPQFEFIWIDYYFKTVIIEFTDFTRYELHLGCNFQTTIVSSLLSWDLPWTLHINITHQVSCEGKFLTPASSSTWPLAKTCERKEKDNDDNKLQKVVNFSVWIIHAFCQLVFLCILNWWQARHDSLARGMKSELLLYWPPVKA